MCIDHNLYYLVNNEDLCPLATKMEALVVETIQDKNRQEQSGENLLGKLKVGHLSIFLLHNSTVMGSLYIH